MRRRSLEGGVGKDWPWGVHRQLTKGEKHQPRWLRSDGFPGYWTTAPMWPPGTRILRKAWAVLRRFSGLTLRVKE